jgi:cardiolipin synthase
MIELMLLPMASPTALQDPENAGDPAVTPTWDGPKAFVADDVAGHRIEVISSGEARLHRLLRLIADARQSIAIIMYIFVNDAAGSQICQALVAAAERGVKVRLIIDSFGSAKLSNTYYEPLKQAGGEVLFFSKKLRFSYLIRNHQKLILIDDRIAMTGGFNLEQGYLSDAGDDIWLDLGFVIEGPSVKRAKSWCDKLYAYTRDHDGKLLKLRRIIRRWPVGRGPITWLVGGPTERLSPWTRTLRKDMVRAKKLTMAMAYFSPGQLTLRKLGQIAHHGEAHFIMAGKSDNPATMGASRLLYGPLLKRGALISEFEQKMLHMKLIIIDNITYIGTANFDVRSLFINVELMIRIDNSDFADKMRRLVGEIAVHSQVITPDLHKRRASLWTKFRWSLSYLIVGVMDYTVSRRLNFGLEKRPFSRRSKAPEP